VYRRNEPSIPIVFDIRTRDGRDASVNIAPVAKTAQPHVAAKLPSKSAILPPNPPHKPDGPKTDAEKMAAAVKFTTIAQDELAQAVKYFQDGGIADHRVVQWTGFAEDSTSTITNFTWEVEKLAPVREAAHAVSSAAFDLSYDTKQGNRGDEYVARATAVTSQLDTLRSQIQAIIDAQSKS
jgi:hypothetical protein